MKRMITSYLLVLGSLMPTLCLGQDVPDREKRANVLYENTRNLIESREYEFIADRLISSTGFSNSIVGTPNTVRVQGEEVRVYLPYFGEVRANSPYQTDGGIKYEGPMENYEVEYRDAKRRVVITFEIDRGIENHNFMLSIGKDGSTRVTVISSGRTSISYYGITGKPSGNWGD